MIRSVRNLLSRKDMPSAPSETPDLILPQPAFPTYAIGDIHGRADLLELMLELVDAHIGGTQAQNPHLVFCGDYIDHGLDSAAVLVRLRELTEDFPENVVCLMGNHERMLLDFLADPLARGPRWLRAGGAATLMSFDIDPQPLIDDPRPAQFTEARARLSDALPDGTLDWIRTLPLSWHTGNLWAVHAGADPYHAMADQTDRVLLWGHPEFDSVPRVDDIWIVHGHNETGNAAHTDGRIAVDTGAWSTNRLTACALRTDGHFDFLQT